jgi:leucyl-tRNA synthetase
MVAQMKPLGFGLDWSRMFATCDPEYYGQQQALFLDFSKAGLIDRKNATVNWDPVDMTVLANEQVIDGKGWRSGAEVERRELTQWFFKISDFSEELLERSDGLDDWPAKVKLMQANWIGKSRGLQFAFGLTSRRPVMTGWRSTRPGPTRCWARPSSASRPTIRWPRSWRRMIRRSPNSAPRRGMGGTTEEAIEKAEKLGFDTGLTCRHPFDTSWELPVYIANFILMDYGTGAIFGCPAHDQRDLDFARKYGLDVCRPSCRSAIT